MKVNKAALKRANALRFHLKLLVEKQLINFQDEYLGMYVSWSIGKMQRELADNIEKNGTEYEGRDYNGKVVKRVYNYDGAIKRLETELSRKNMLTYEFINTAKNGYTAKFNKLLDKLVGFGFEADNYKNQVRVDFISNIGHEFEFMVYNNDMEVHARVILAQGEINAPHYRFITTKRNK